MGRMSRAAGSVALQVGEQTAVCAAPAAVEGPLLRGEPRPLGRMAALIVQAARRRARHRALAADPLSTTSTGLAPARRQHGLLSRRVSSLLTGAAIAYASSAAMAAEPATTAAVGATPAGLGGQVVQLILGLLLVVGLIFFLAWLLRRVQGVAPGQGHLIEVLSSRAIGPRDRLLLVQVGKEQILLGHSPGNIEALHVLAEPVEVPVGKRTTPTPEFAQRLLELMGKDQKDTPR